MFKVREFEIDEKQRTVPIQLGNGLRYLSYTALADDETDSAAEAGSIAVIVVPFLSRGSAESFLAMVKESGLAIQATDSGR